MSKRRAGYHHGTLRAAALKEAFRILDAQGLEGFTLDRLAKALGVTAPALYRHFADREDLLRALVLDGFSRFLPRMDQAVLGAAEPMEALRALGRVYVRFALENPGWFRLQFSRAGVAAGGDHQEDLPAYAPAAWAALAQVLGTDDPQRVQGAYLMIWGLAHGLSGLLVERVLGHVQTDDERIALADSLLDAQLEGFARAAR